MGKYKSKLFPIVFQALTSYPFIEKDFDALTTYQLLQAIVERINALIGVAIELDDRVEQTVRETLDEWLADGTLADIITDEVLKDLKRYYTPEDFGGVGDGLTDCSDAFDQACKAMANGDIKILFIPQENTYRLTQCIAIPAGCTLVGGGITSRIYFDDSNLPSGHYGVGITTGGDNVTISDLCIDHYQNGAYNVTGALTGALSVGTLEHAGIVTIPVADIARSNRSNIIINNIYMTHGRYCLQCDPSADYTIDNVYVNNILAPMGMVSIAPRSGGLRNIHYSNIRCDVLRVGNDSNYYGYDITVEHAYCTYLINRARGAHISDVLIDRSQLSGYEANHLMDIRSGNILENIRIIPGADTTYITILRGLDGNCFRFKDCDFTGVTKFSVNSGIGDASYPDPVYFESCVVSQTGESTNAIIGAAVMGSVTIPVLSGFQIWPSL